MSESVKYARSTEGRVIFLAFQLTFCHVCKLPIVRGQLFTRGWPGNGRALVCYECRSFEVDEEEVNINWEGNPRPELDFVEI